MNPRQHPRRRPGRPGLFAMPGGQAVNLPAESSSSPPPAPELAGNLPAPDRAQASRDWLLHVGAQASPGEVQDVVAAALRWDRDAAAEPYQVDLTREIDDTVRMGNSLSAAVRLELLADHMREELLDRPGPGHPPDEEAAVFDDVSGDELDPVDGLPLPAEDEDQVHEHVPTLEGRCAVCRAQLDEWGQPVHYQDLADLQAAALRYAAPPPPRADVEEEPAPVAMSPAQSAQTSGAPARILNWTSRHDPRSLEYGVRARLRAPAPLMDRLWPHGPILDQGTTPPLSLHDASGCTGHAGVNAHNVLELAAGRGNRLLDGADAMRLYDRAQELDEVPGEAYPGTSILAVMKAGQEAGLWGGYLWAFGTKDVAQAVLQVGPVVIGVPWLPSMAEPGPDGIITVAREVGDVVTGHALCLFALRMNVAGRAGPWFGAVQTYGADVGDQGEIWFHHRDLGNLLRSRGEAAIPVPEQLEARRG